MDQDDQGQERHRQASRVLCLHLVELTLFFCFNCFRYFNHFLPKLGEDMGSGITQELHLERPKHPLDPAFLSTIRLFLTRSYREGFETWEAPLFGEKVRFP